jgi:hypothetical protein
MAKDGKKDEKKLTADAEIVLANARAKDLDFELEVIKSLLALGEKFGKKRLAVYSEMQKSGVDVNNTLKDLLTEVSQRPKAHEDKAKGADELFKQTNETVKILLGRSDLWGHVDRDIMEKLATDIAELVTKMTAQKK